MVPLYVACIVEGQGDFNAAPALLKRLVKFVNPVVYADVRPFRVTRSKLLLMGELERAVEPCRQGTSLTRRSADRHRQRRRLSEGVGAVAPGSGHGHGQRPVAGWSRSR